MRGLGLIGGDGFGAATLHHIVDPVTAGNRWVAGASAATQKYVQGVQDTNVDVVGRAIAAQNALLANLTQSITSGRWARNLAAVGTGGWKQITAAKSAAYGTGVAASEAKYVAAVGPLFQFMASEQSKIAGMPSGTISDSVARATTWMTDLHNWKLSR
jgi:hypothetical protein